MPLEPVHEQVEAGHGAEGVVVGRSPAEECRDAGPILGRGVVGEAEPRNPAPCRPRGSVAVDLLHRRQRGDRPPVGSLQVGCDRPDTQVDAEQGIAPVRMRPVFGIF